MAKRFVDKVVIVTGSTSGIGQAAACRFAQEGAFVTIHGRNPDGMKQTVSKLHDLNISDDRILQVFGDVKEETTLKKIIDETVKKFGKIDALINNAGNSAEEAGLDSGHIESIDHILDMNLKSVMKLTAFALPHLEKTKGNVVNVSSVDAIKPHPESLNYSVSKAALDQYTRNACVVFGSRGIRINNLNPGYIHTNIKQRNGMDEKKLEEFHTGWVKRNVPLKRPGESEEMANVLAFLASDEASFMTGSIVVADGGLICYGEPQDADAKF